MKASKRVTTYILAVAATLVCAGQAGAAQQEWSGIDAEIRSCVATVGQNANYADATRVRHDIVGVKERTVGYKLTIETSLYNERDDAAIREYATYCVVNGSNAPMQFSISESDDDA
jgi:hypothetical protein